MPDETKPSADEGGSGRPLTVLGSLAILAVVALAALYALVQTGQGGGLEITRGGVKVEFERGDSLADVIDRALEDPAQRGELARVLAPHDFYHIQDVRWTNRLREIDAEPGVRDSLLQLLYDLDGPFSLPGTFALADDRLYAAVVELDDKLKAFEPDTPNASANAFFATIWRDQLNQDGVFQPRSFRANVINLEAPHAIEHGRHVVYVCPGSELEGRNLTLVLSEPDRPTLAIPALARVDLVRLDCGDTREGIMRYLARQTARMGLARDGFARLYGEVAEGATLPQRATARFQVAPLNYAEIPSQPPEEE